MKSMVNITEDEKALVRTIAAGCESSAEIADKLKKLFASAMETMLQAEMDAHLGYEKNDVAGNNSGNSRNGYGTKTIQSEWGEQEIAVPRDRNGTFEPKIIEKRQTRTDEIEDKIIAMYSKGISTRDIEDQLRDIYGVDVSASLISAVTNKILPEMTDWQNRPLDELYTVVYFDGVVYKVRKDSKIIHKTIYSVLGINSEGYKEILGLWMSETESASFWTTVCNDLRNRGVKDILIACHDNLNGFGAAINTVFPQTRQQLCIVHMIRNSVKFVPYKDKKSVCADLKLVYGAPNEEAALNELVKIKEKWDSRYPQIYKMWEQNWADLNEFFKYPEQVRTLIYTTNAVEGFHRMLRKFTKTKSVFPTDDSLRKSIYLSIKEIAKKWTMPVRDWGIIAGQLGIFFENRFAA
jgi:putative transposase